MRGRRRLLLLLLMFLIIKSPLYFPARNFGGGNGNGWFVGEGGRNLMVRCIFLFLFFISCCGDDCFCCYFCCCCFCCGGGIDLLLSRTVEETNLGEGRRDGKGGGGVVIVDVRNRGGIGFGEIGIWAFRELWNFLGCGVFIIIVLEAALPVESMCELEFSFFVFFLIVGRSW